MDLKIAAITIANQATLLTRNLSDFGQIPVASFAHSLKNQ
jgi:predicted nucleic acid-binding protein